MPDHFFVYPAYLDRSVPRALGRRVPAARAVPDVTAEEVRAAAEALGFQAEVEPEHQYPPVFHTYSGRVKVHKKAGVTKTRCLFELATEIGRVRAQGRKA